MGWGCAVEEQIMGTEFMEKLVADEKLLGCELLTYSAHWV